MKRRMLFPLLAPVLFILIGCDTESPLTPEVPEVPEQLAQAFAPSNPINGWSFEIEAVFTGPVELGISRITPGNVLHVDGAKNGFVMAGDLEGMVYFDGAVHVSLKQGMGPAIGNMIFDITSPRTGGFVCQTQGVQDHFSAGPDYPGVDYTFTGKIYSCEGSGEYEDSRLKGTFAYQTGVIPSTYDMAGVIY